MKKKRQQPQEGIHFQAQTVRAGALSIGNHSRAIQFNASARKDMIEAVDRLVSAVGLLPSNISAKAPIEAELKGLRDEAHSDQPDPNQLESRMKRIAGKLKAAGVIVTELVAISEPVKKIAEMLGTTIGRLGW